MGKKFSPSKTDEKSSPDNFLKGSQSHTPADQSPEKNTPSKSSQ